MRVALLIAVLPLLAPQDPGYTELARKCGSTVKWSAEDPWVPKDKTMGQPGPPAKAPQVDRGELFNKAVAEAKSASKLVLWYAFRVAGVQTYRAPVPDNYMTQVVFSDPEIVELVNRRFVPVRLYGDAKMSEITGIKYPDFAEPGIAIFDGDGKLVHCVNRVRSFNPDWFLSLLVAVVKKHAKDKPTGSAEELMLAGDYEAAAAALAKEANPYVSACLKRRQHDYDGALEALKDAKSDGLVETEKALIHLRTGRLDDAKKGFEAASKMKSPRQAEARYHLAAVLRFTGDDDAAAKQLAAVVTSHADSPWGWRAAACLNKSQDTTPDGALVHAFEDLFRAPDIGETLPKDTNWVRGEKDVDDIVKRAVEFLLRHQREDGGWSDTRYAYWPDPSILPNTRVSVTAACCAALSEWRDVDPKRIDKALEKGEKFCLDEKNMLRGKNEESYADSYKLLYLARKHANAKGSAGKTAATKATVAPINGLVKLQARDGSWAHEYPNPWITGVVIQALGLAKKIGGPVPDETIAKGAQILAKSRSKEGGFPYDFGRPASNLKDSLGRGPVAEHALQIGGLGTLPQIEASLENWWAKYSEIEIVRRNDFHSNGELAGFFFYHDVFHSCEAALALGQKERDAQLEKFLKLIVTLPEIDGSFVDSHEIGKSYGTAMALLTIKNSVRFKTATKK